MTTAFVLSGGGSLGAVQVGMLQALVDHQITPDLLVGTSAGALNAAFIAGHGVDAKGGERLNCSRRCSSKPTRSACMAKRWTPQREPISATSHSP